jgi:hypothetical protein
MTKTMNEQTNDTLQDQILKILFAEGLGEGLANIFQILMNATCSLKWSPFRCQYFVRFVDPFCGSLGAGLFCLVS